MQYLFILYFLNLFIFLFLVFFFKFCQVVYFSIVGYAAVKELLCPLVSNHFSFFLFNYSWVLCIIIKNFQCRIRLIYFTSRFSILTVNCKLLLINTNTKYILYKKAHIIMAVLIDHVTMKYTKK